MIIEENIQSKLVVKFRQNGVPQVLSVVFARGDRFILVNTDVWQSIILCLLTVHLFYDSFEMRYWIRILFFQIIEISQ